MMQWLITMDIHSALLTEIMTLQVLTVQSHMEVDGGTAAATVHTSMGSLVGTDQREVWLARINRQSAKLV
jgi:hypothetical protein